MAPACERGITPQHNDPQREDSPLPPGSLLNFLPPGGSPGSLGHGDVYLLVLPSFAASTSGALSKLPELSVPSFSP